MERWDNCVSIVLFEIIVCDRMLWIWLIMDLIKEYYEIVDEACPLSGFFSTHDDFFTEYAFLTFYWVVYHKQVL